MGASHKEVYILFVGTGVHDCPQRHNCYTEDKDNPDRFCRGYFAM